MNTPNIRCKILGYCSILPSEDPKKVQMAIENILPDSEIQIENDSAKIISKDLDSLKRIFETIHSRKTQRTYLRHMKRNLNDTSTWFYLNKQAAFANNVALCDDADESPLGPIKLILESNQIERIIEWLTIE